MLWNHSKINGPNQLQAILERSRHLKKKKNVLPGTWTKLPTASLPPLIMIHLRTFQLAKHGSFLQSKVKSRWAKWKINERVEALNLVRSCLLCAVLDEQKQRGAWITELYQNEGEWGKVGIAVREVWKKVSALQCWPRPWSRDWVLQRQAHKLTSPRKPGPLGLEAELITELFKFEFFLKKYFILCVLCVPMFVLHHVCADAC